MLVEIKSDVSVEFFFLKPAYCCVGMPLVSRNVDNLFIMLCQFHTIISAQIQTQEYTNYGRVYATALRQLQQPLQNKHDTFYIRSLVI